MLLCFHVALKLASVHSFSFIVFANVPFLFYHPLLIPCVVQRPGKLVHVAFALPYLLPTLGFMLPSPITLRTPNDCPSECLMVFPCCSLPCFPHSLTNRNVCVLIFSEWHIFLSQFSYWSMTLCTTATQKIVNGRMEPNSDILWVFFDDVLQHSHCVVVNIRI